MEVIVGSYDQVLFGFNIKASEDPEKDYEFEPRFLNRSHAGCIKSLTTGGPFLSSGSSDETIRLFNLKEHKEIGVLMQHEGSITCLTFHGANHMLSSSEDKTICVWECKNWDCVRTLKGHRAPVTSVSVHPSGRLALSVSKDKTLRTWNLVTGRAAYVTNIKEVATLVKWSPSGEKYVVIIDSKVVFYKLAVMAGVSFKMNRPLASLSYTLTMSKHVLAVEFLEENVVAVGGETEGIHIYDIEKEKCLQIIAGHESRVKALASLEDPLSEEKRTLLLSVSSDGDLRAWSLDPEDFSKEPKLKARYVINGRPTCLAVYSEHSRTPQYQSAQTAKHVSGELAAKREKKGKEKQNYRRSTSESGEEPRKKKHKKKKIKKKKSAKGGARTETNVQNLNPPEEDTLQVSSDNADDDSIDNEDQDVMTE